MVVVKWRVPFGWVQRVVAQRDYFDGVLTVSVCGRSLCAPTCGRFGCLVSSFGLLLALRGHSLNVGPDVGAWRRGALVWGSIVFRGWYMAGCGSSCAQRREYLVMYGLPFLWSLGVTAIAVCGGPLRRRSPKVN
jgi:hypothetical protein